jgi:hypothetical protein
MAQVMCNENLPILLKKRRDTTGVTGNLGGNERLR